MQLVDSVTPFAEWLDLELTARGWTRSKLAGYMGKPQSTVSSWFNDDRIPQTDLCIELARVLRISPQEVLRQAYPALALAEERAPYGAALPDWTRLLPMLSQEDALYVGRLVERLAQNPAQPDPPTAPEEPR